VTSLIDPPSRLLEPAMVWQVSRRRSGQDSHPLVSGGVC
jgi:hypothetical protein